MHQGSALSPLLFVIVMEALSREYRVALPWVLLYADDLVVIVCIFAKLAFNKGALSVYIESSQLHVCDMIGWLWQIAASLLLFMEEEDAFWMLCTIIEDLLPASYYSSTLIGVQVPPPAFLLMYM